MIRHSMTPVNLSHWFCKPAMQLRPQDRVLRHTILGLHVVGVIKVNGNPLGSVDQILFDP